jgi:hypothetical protein
LRGEGRRSASGWEIRRGGERRSGEGAGCGPDLASFLQFHSVIDEMLFDVRDNELNFKIASMGFGKLVEAIVNRLQIG